jgi:hypothetical protein
MKSQYHQTINKIKYLLLHCFSVFFLTCNCNFLSNNPQQRPIEPRLLGKWVNSDTLWEDNTKKNCITYYLLFRDDRTYSRLIWRQVGDTFSDLGGSYGEWYKYADTEIVVFYNYDGYMGHPGGTNSQHFVFHFNSLDTVELFCVTNAFYSWPNYYKKFVKKDSIFINGRWW